MKQLSMNYTDTAISGANVVSLELPTLNYGADFRVKKDEPSEAIITNLTSPINQPERLRIAHSDVADVYRNSGIDPTLYYPSKRGTQILVQLTDVFKVTDTEDASYEAHLPISAHLVVKVPNNELITPDVVVAEIERLIAGLYETTGTTTESRIKSVLRGALLPASL